jgi:hypothetical protein
VWIIAMQAESDQREHRQLIVFQMVGGRDEEISASIAFDDAESENKFEFVE